MISADRDALVCDLAETYGIFDYRALPASLLATLSVGLRDNSRIKMKLSGIRATRSEILIAAAVDRLSMMLWMITSESGGGKPPSVLKAILGEQIEDNGGEVDAYETPDDFEAEWERITGVSHGR